MYRFYINDTQINDHPIGWEDFKESLERDDSVKGLLMKYPLNLTFFGDGYNIIEDELVSNGRCQTLSLKIDILEGVGYRRLLDGIIRITGTRTNLNKRHIECPVEDNSYSAKIQQNKSVKVRIDSVKSKNGVTITPAARLSLVLTGIVTGGGSIGIYDIKEVFRFLIDYMTDGTVSFESTWLDSLPSEEHISICRGAGLRTPEGGAAAPTVSFDEVIDEINKKYRIGFVVEKDSDGNPVIRIEKESTLFAASPVLTLDNIQDLKLTYNKDRLYSSVRLGSETQYEYSPDLPVITSFPPITLLGFRKEEYPIQGQCNSDKVLDLVSSWVIDSNTIEKVIKDQIEDYDDDIFIIQYDDAGITNSAPATSYYSSPDFSGNLFNEQLLNIKVAERWGVQGSIQAYLDNNDNTFEAKATADSVEYTINTGTINRTIQIQFNDDYSTGHDVLNRYGNGTTQGSNVSLVNSRFTAPYNSTWRFTTTMTVRATEVPQDGRFKLSFEYYDANDNFINNKEDSFVTIDTEDIYTTTFTRDITLNEGDYVIVQLYIEFVSTTGDTLRFYIANTGIYTPALFKAEEIFETYDTLGEDLPEYVNTYTFERELNREEWNTILEDPSKPITINHDGLHNINVWVKKITRNTTKTSADLELINNGN